MGAPWRHTLVRVCHRRRAAHRRGGTRPAAAGGAHGLLAAVVLVSHPLFDTLTNGGLGCALFWPFDNTRYFAPWTPIPVSPIGLAYFSPYGLMVAITEIVFFSPLLIFGLWPPKERTTHHR